MARLVDAIIGNAAYGNGNPSAMLNIGYGGQFGWAPNMAEWISNQAYVQRNIFAVLVEYPKFFDSMPNSTMFVQALKSLIETKPIRIEGLQSGITVEKATHAVGGAGEMQEEVVNSTRARSIPVHTYQDQYGRPIQNFLEFYIQYGMMDPETKSALAATVSGIKPADWLADMYTFTVLYFEPDISMTQVNKAWLTTNMCPESNGDLTGKRDLTSALGLGAELSITFGGITQHGSGVKAFAQNYLTAMNLTNANPSLAASFVQAIDPAVTAANADGLVEGITALEAGAVVGGAYI